MEDLHRFHQSQVNHLGLPERSWFAVHTLVRIDQPECNCQAPPQDSGIPDSLRLVRVAGWHAYVVTVSLPKVITLAGPAKPNRKGFDF